ncbi:MAG: DUF4115 domain-containing protein [Xanthomonadaceae bacterium]|nr:DUF4115 domain-containing protein [Xanthomonadaceae bacterium]MDE1964363.1 DUF4115 domain-containing protein [Xanthomonadaceae bacterium]
MNSAQPSMQDQTSSEQPAPDSAPVAVEATFGQRLRAARQARGVDIESCGQALRLPARVLRQLEDDRYDGIDYKVYLGSYITKYGRYLGIDDAIIQAEVSRIRRRNEPELVVTGGISHSRYLLERYATAATYVVLTAVIVVPVVWLGIRGTLNRDIAHLAPLDAAPVAQQEMAATGRSTMASPLAPSAPALAPSVKAEDEQPLMASMVPNITADTVKPVVPAAPTGGESDPGAHTLTLALTDASWVEVTSQDGTRLEYGLLPAGTHRTYHSDSPLDVRLGNAGGASVTLDGQAVSLDPYRHANVAHFRVQIEDGKAAPASL